MNKQFIRHFTCFSILSMLLIGAFLIVATERASAAQDGDYTYSIDANYANITGYVGTGGAIEIPSELDGYETVAIGDYAFFQITSLTSVIIPNSITYIGEGAFDQCANLTSMTFGDGITIIEDYAFANCSSLTSMVFLGLTSPAIGGVNWTMGTPDTIRGHAYAASNFPVLGDVFNGLIMGDVIPIAPDIPTGLIATPGKAQVVLEWTAPANDGGSPITGYNVYRSATETGTYSLIGSPTEPTFMNVGLTNGQTYWYEVGAVNEAGEGARTAPVSSVPFTTPDAPTGLMATAGDSSVTLSWTAPAFDGGRAIDYYVVYKDSFALTDHPTGLSILITGLTNGQSYSFTVAAHNFAGVGAISDAASTTPRAAPEAPTGLTATPGNSQITLGWSAPTSEGGSAITNYNIYRSTTSGGEAILDTIGNVLGYTDSGLTNGQTYFYRVSAVNAAGESPLSNEATATPVTVPTAPRGLQAVAGDAVVDLNWTVPEYAGPEMLTYHLFRDGSLILSGAILTYSDTSVANGVTYSYKVAASNSVGWGPNCSAVLAVPTSSDTVPTSPRGLTATPGVSRVNLNWTEPSYVGPGTITYHLFRDGSEVWSGIATAHQDALLTKGVQHSYTVAVQNSLGWGPNCTAVMATPFGVPDAPFGLNAIVGSGFLSLNWTAPAYLGPGSVTYHLFRDNFLIWEGSGLKHEDADVTNGITYAYEVSASNDIGWGENSTVVQVTPMSDEQRPTAPRNLMATAGLENVTLAWDAPAYSNASSVSGYIISYGISSDSFTNQITSDQLVYVLDGLTKGTTYYFKVAALNNAGWGTNSSVRSATPFGVPSVPLGLVAIAGNGYVLLNWTAPTYVGPGPTMYHLFRDGSLIWNGTTILFLDIPLIKNTSFSYQVALENSISWGPNCTAVLATPFGAPDAPWGLSATSGDASISLSWNAVNYSGPGNLTYHLFRDGALVWSGVAVDYEDFGLINGQTYDYNVAASNSVGWGANSSGVSSIPEGRPTAPTGLRVNAGNNFVQLNWTAPLYGGPGTITYHLFRNGTSIYAGNAVEYNDTSALNFIDYSYQVAAENSIGWGLNSTIVQAIPMPSGMKPTVIRDLAIISGNENVTLTWDTPLYSNASVVSGYMISFGTSPDSLTNLIIWNQLSYTLEGLTKGTTYYFNLAAQNRAGWGPNSTIVSGTPFGVPNEPTNLSAIAGNAQVTLSWNTSLYSGPGSLSYHLFRDGALIWSGSELSHIDLGLTNGHPYLYKASISNDVGWGPNSTEVLATPMEHVLPGVPIDFHVIAGDGYVELSWRPPINNGSATIFGYKIYRLNNSVMMLLKTVTSATSYNDTTISNGETYAYQVCAYSSVGDGPATEIQSVHVQATPTFKFELDPLFLVGIGLIGIIVLIDVVIIMRKKRK